MVLLTENLFQITFVGEGDVDNGGPKREFFRLFAQVADKIYFIGQSGQPKFFRGDILAVQVHTGMYTNLCDHKSFIFFALEE